jgi:hypothetical protein
MVYHLLEKRERRVEIYFALYREEVFVVLE